MLITKTIIIQLFLLIFVPNMLLAEQTTGQSSQQNFDPNNNKPDQEIVTDQHNKQDGPANTESEQGAETSISPLLTEEQEHGQLYLSAFDPEHQLYPIQLIVIDGWIVTDDIVGKPLLLAEGEHQLKVVPDFSNIYPQKVFMASDWPEQKIGFSIKKEEHLAVAARLIDKLTLQWKVEIYRIAAPAEEFSDEPNLIIEE